MYHQKMAGAVSLRAEEEASAWSSRCEGLRAALQAQEAHAEALERELATRPSAKQVRFAWSQHKATGANENLKQDLSKV